MGPISNFDQFIGWVKSLKTNFGTNVKIDSIILPAFQEPYLISSVFKLGRKPLDEEFDIKPGKKPGTAHCYVDGTRIIFAKHITPAGTCLFILSSIAPAIGPDAAPPQMSAS